MSLSLDSRLSHRLDSRGTRTGSRDNLDPRLSLSHIFYRKKGHEITLLPPSAPLFTFLASPFTPVSLFFPTTSINQNFWNHNLVPRLIPTFSSHLWSQNLHSSFSSLALDNRTINHKSTTCLGMANDSR